jgi:tetratricopeptide (TPR) repeat protein
MKHVRAIVALCCLVPYAYGGTAESDSARFDELTRQGIEQVYNLEFEQADETFEELVRLRPQHPAGHFFLAMVQWWRILIDIENTEYDESFFAKLDHVIDLCDEMLEKNDRDVTALFFKGGALGFKGRLEFHRDDWLAAANAGRKALPIVQDASAADPGNYDIFLGTGIYNYYAAVIPEQYPFVKPLLLFIPGGDRQKGIQQLTIAAEKGKYASVEATYFLMQLNYLYEKDYRKALQLAMSLHARFPNNMLFHRYVGRCYVSLNDWENATAVFSEIVDRSERKQRGYGKSTEREALYYLGMYSMNQHRYEEALAHLYRCDSLSRSIDRESPSGFMVMANLKIGNIYDLLARRDLAVQQYEKVLDLKEYKESYRLAEQYLKTPYIQ